jgi:ABC-type transporter Mla subunit MlaD
MNTFLVGTTLVLVVLAAFALVWIVKRIASNTGTSYSYRTHVDEDGNEIEQVVEVTQNTGNGQ